MNSELAGPQTTIYIAATSGKAAGWGAVIVDGLLSQIEQFGCDGGKSSQDRLIWALLRAMAIVNPERPSELLVVTASKHMAEVVAAVSNPKVQAAMFGKMGPGAGSEAFRHVLSIAKVLRGSIVAKLVGRTTETIYGKRAEQLAQIAAMTGRSQWSDPYALWRKEQSRSRREAKRAAKASEQKKRREWSRANTVLITVTVQDGYKSCNFVNRKIRIPKEQLPAFEATPPEQRLALRAELALQRQDSEHKAAGAASGRGGVGVTANLFAYKHPEAEKMMEEMAAFKEELEALKREEDLKQTVGTSESRPGRVDGQPLA